MEVKMAWRNVWRHPRRSLLTMLAIAFATTILIFMLSWQFGSYETMINAAVSIHSGHLQVQAPGYHDSADIHRVVPDPGRVLAVLHPIPSIQARTLRANTFSLVSSAQRTYGALVVGIDPGSEAKVSTLASLVRQGAYLEAADRDQALVGSLLARNLRVGIGDEIVILGQGRDGSVAATVVKVKGIFKSGQDQLDRQFLYIPLPYFQEVYSMEGAVHQVVLSCSSLDQVEATKAAALAALAADKETASLVVLDWKELIPGLLEAIKMDLVSGLIFYVILVIVVAFSILNTFLMAVFERLHEFGVMLAVGTRPWRLSRIILFESAMITAGGILMGMVAGSLLTWYFQAHGIAISGAEEILRQFGMPERIYPHLSLLSLSIGPTLVLAITMLTALYPALRLRGLRPVAALGRT